MSTIHENIKPFKRNWQIYQLYAQHQFEEALKLIEEQLKENQGLCEYPIFVKGLIRRQEGHIRDSLTLFRAASCLNPKNIDNFKQIGRSQLLIGQFEAAIETFDKVEELSDNEDWQVYHNKGMAFKGLKRYEDSVEEFQNANSIMRHDCTFMELAEVHLELEQTDEAIEVLQEALEFSPDNAEILTTLGLTFLRNGDSTKAFEYLGRSMTYDSADAKTILAAGSIIQDHSDLDVALSKYRKAAATAPHSAHLWNNIGMCFFGKEKYIAAVSCLKRAHYLEPFEWIIAYNLGIIFLNTGQFAGAFHYLSAAINLKPDFANSYMYLAIALARLGDFENAASGYQKALNIDDNHMIHLNYAILLVNNDENEAAKRQFNKFEEKWSALSAEEREEEADAEERRQLLGKQLGIELVTNE